MGCITDLSPFRHLEADEDDLYNYTILTRDVPKRIGERKLRRYIDDQDNEKGYGCIGQYWELGKGHLLWLYYYAIW